MNSDKNPAKAAGVEGLIYVMRGQRVMLSTDLARLYGVTPKVLVQAVKRNRSRFPDDFMFLVGNEEVVILRSQIVTLKGHGKHAKYPPYAFTEQGVAMLSSVLRSDRAIDVNVAIMRAFVKLRETLGAQKDLAEKLSELERRVSHHDEGIQALFEAIRTLMAPPEVPKKQIGFHVRERSARYATRQNRANAARR